MRRFYLMAAAGLSMLMAGEVQAVEVSFTHACPFTVYSSYQGNEYGGDGDAQQDRVTEEMADEMVTEEPDDDQYASYEEVEVYLAQLGDATADASAPLPDFVDASGLEEETMDTTAEMEDDTEQEEPDSGNGQVSISAMTVYGRIDSEYVVVRIDGQIGFITVAELAENAPALDLSTLPDASDWDICEPDSRGMAVSVVQEQLTNRNYLDDMIDGVYGNNTYEAVMRFQQEHGLKVTGKCDLVTRLVIAETEMDPVTVEYTPDIKVEDKFASIIEYTDPKALEPYVMPEWEFTYDPEKGIGKLDANIEVARVRDDSSDLSRIDISMKQIVFLQKKDERIRTIPSICVSNVGAHRLYIRSLVISDGEQTIELSASYCESMMKGTSLYETTVIPLTKESYTMIMKAAGDVTIRIMGQAREMSLIVDSGKFK